MGGRGDRHDGEQARRPRPRIGLVAGCGVVAIASFATIGLLPEGSAWQTVAAAACWSAVLSGLGSMAWWATRLVLRAAAPSPRYRLEPAAWPDGPDGPPAPPAGPWSRPVLHRVGRVAEQWASTDGRGQVRVLGAGGWSLPLSQRTLPVPFTSAELAAAVAVAPLWFVATMALFAASQATHGSPTADAGSIVAVTVAVGLVAGGLALVLLVWLVRHHEATRAAAWPAGLASAD